jgi:hypothetical protein
MGRNPEASMRPWLSPAAPTFPFRGYVGRICNPRSTVFALDCVCLDLFLAVRARATVSRPGAANGSPAVLAPNRIGPDLFLAEVAFLCRCLSHNLYLRQRSCLTAVKLTRRPLGFVVCERRVDLSDPRLPRARECEEPAVLHVRAVKPDRGSLLDRPRFPVGRHEHDLPDHFLQEPAARLVRPLGPQLGNLDPRPLLE